MPRAEGASAEVGMEVAPHATNVIGSLHSSGLAALVDAALQALVEGDTDRAQLTTEATVADAAGAIVCLGSFSWKPRRSPAAP